jgi:DNA polymerase-3 subunit epsilon
MLPNIEEINPDFIALDVETANEDFWSICQIGLAYFKNGEIVDTWKSYVNPETDFASINIDIHGITSEMVQGAIKLPELYDRITRKITGFIVVHHMPFDRVAFRSCAEYLNRSPLSCKWLDTARVARRTWEEVRISGYSLTNLSFLLNIPHEKPHDALDDAITAGRVFLKAIERTNLSIEEWLIRSHSDMADQRYRTLANSEPDPNGSLYGEVVVFTGALSITRMEAAQLAYRMGCNIDAGVNKHTTILVVGDQDSRKLAGYNKSSKHRKTEELITQGQSIRIIGEDDFKSMIDY